MTTTRSTDPRGTSTHAPDTNAPSAAPAASGQSPTTPGPLLAVTDLHVTLGRGAKAAHVLRGAGITVDRGEIVGLIGETGSGKTTMAKTILGLAPVRDGSVRFRGEEIGRLRARDRRALRREGALQYVFQDPLRSLDPDATVLDSIVESLAVRGGSSRAELRRAAEELCTLVSLPADVLARHPGEISGGQRQRVAIARAMALRPDLLICDEPVSALDAANRIRILDLLVELRTTQRLGVLLITHDLGSLAGVADRVSVLYRGEIVESGTTAQIFTAPQHPYTQLLVASVPSLFGEPAAPEHLDRLRAELAALPTD